jgi:hypothetical protein
MRRRSLLHLLLATAVTFVGTSCLSPTLPLPPPVVDSMTELAEGLWAISGQCQKGALVTVFNETQGQGAVVEDRDQSARFLVVLTANRCELGWASQVLGTEGSRPESFVIPCPGATDAGTSDADTSDAGTNDAGTNDAGTSDADTSDAGTSDAGTSDAGSP